MADKKISELAAAAAFSDTDLFVVVQVGSTLKMTGAQLKAAFLQNPLTAVGDIFVGGASGQPARLPLGANGKILGVVSGALAWVDPPSSGGGSDEGMTNPMTALGDIIVGGADGVALRLAGGTANQVLQMVAGSPAWVTLTNLTNPMTAAHDLIVGGVSGSPTRLAAPSTAGYVLTWDGADLVWAAPSVTPVQAPVLDDPDGSRPLALTDANKYLRPSSSSATTYTVPTQATVAWAANTEITIEQAGTGSVTIAAASGVTINILSTNTPTIVGRYGVVTLKRVGSNLWTLFGALS